MKNFEIDVQYYPKTYQVKAENELIARAMARDLFHRETGQTVYHTDLVREEEIN